MECVGKLRFGNPYFDEINYIPEISFEDMQIPEYISNFSIIDSASSELSYECDINLNLLNALTGIDLAYGVDMSYSVETRGSHQVQKRRHKKKRINKKWAKRYGYRTILDDVKIRDCTLVTHNDCDVEFVGTPELITKDDNDVNTKI